MQNGWYGLGQIVIDDVQWGNSVNDNQMTESLLTTRWSVIQSDHLKKPARGLGQRAH